MPPIGANAMVKDPEYCNWLKVVLVLYYLKVGLSSFIQDVVNDMHTFILQYKLKASTVPAPFCSICAKNGIKQYSKGDTWTWEFPNPCPASLCDRWLRELLALRRDPDKMIIYIKNCDVTAWPTTPWECAKFYMPRGQTVDKTGPAESDSQALLTLIANCKFFQSKMSLGGTNLTYTVSAIRNKVMHSKDMKLSDNERTSFITDIIKLLEDPSHLKSLDECKKAVVEIKKINTASLEVFFNTDMEMEMKALSECVKDLRQELGVHKLETEKTVESLKEEYNNLLMQMKEETKDQLSQHEKRIRTLEEGRDSQTSGATADVRDIQLLFIKAYKGVQIISVNAVLHNAVHWKDLEDFYTDIVIEEEEEKESTHRIKNEKQLKKAVTSFRQIFEKCDRKITRIILQAPAGQGKSTFCRKVVHTWCSVQNKQLNNPINDGTSDRSETIGLEHEDEMLRFDVLLYICLRDISDAKTLMDVVHEQFPLVETQDHMSHIEALIGQAENNRVLLIMDGLDEMDISLSFIGKIMRRELYPNLTVLATTRSWKIGELGLIRSAHFDLLLDLQGFSFDNSMLFAKKLFGNYYQDESAIAQFQEDILKNNVIRSLIHVPLLLLFIVQVWYVIEQKSFPQTIHELYLEMLDVIVNRYMKGKKRIENNQGKQDQKWPLESTTFNADLKLRKLSLVKHFGADFLAALCEVANHFLINAYRETSLVFDEKDLLELLGKDGASKLQTALDLGILSMSESRSTFREKIRVTFLHKTVQEFLAAINICCREDRCNIFLDSLITFDDVLQNEQIIKFAAGISTTHCQKIYEKIYEVCEKGRLEDTLSNNCMRSLSRICIDCVREARKETLSLKLYGIHARNQKIWNELQSALKNALKVRIQIKNLCLQSCILNDAEFDFFEFQCLTKLKLIHVTVKGKPLLSKCTELKDLELLYCTLDDDVLDLSESICLEKLRLKNVKMKGELLLSKCTELKRLKVDNCTLDDDVLDLSESICLEDLRLKYVKMKGKLLLSKCTGLKCLKVHNCTLDDVLDLSDSICLHDLRLKNVTTEGKLLLSKCSKLCCLNLSNCNFDGYELDLSDSLCLEQFMLTNVTMKGKLLLSKCTHLRFLKLINCTLDDVALDLSECTGVKYILCNRVTLTGRLRCTRVKQLILVNCNLGEVTVDFVDALLSLDSVNWFHELELDNVIMSKECNKVFCNSLSQCEELNRLSIKNLDLCDALLSFSCGNYLRELTLDNVTMNKEYKGVFCNSLSQWEELEKLSISNVDLCDGLHELHNMKRLSYITLEGVKMGTLDKVLKSLCQCTQLMNLTLKNLDLGDGLLSLNNLGKLSSLTVDNVIMCKDGYLMLCSSISTCKHLTLSLKNLDLGDAIPSLDNLNELELVNITMSLKCVDYIKSLKPWQLSSCFKTDLSIEMIANSCDKYVVNCAFKIDYLHDYYDYLDDDDDIDYDDFDDDDSDDDDDLKDDYDLNDL